MFLNARMEMESTGRFYFQNSALVVAETESNEEGARAGGVGSNAAIDMCCNNRWPMNGTWPTKVGASTTSTGFDNIARTYTPDVADGKRRAFGWLRKRHYRRCG